MFTTSSYFLTCRATRYTTRPIADTPTTAMITPSMTIQDGTIGDIETPFFESSLPSATVVYTEYSDKPGDCLVAKVVFRGLYLIYKRKLIPTCGGDTEHHHRWVYDFFHRWACFYNNFNSLARATASVRLRTSSLINMFAVCRLTVPIAMTS